MPFEKDKDLTVKFLKCVSRIKGWHYHDKIENEKKDEIKEFISVYIFKNMYGEFLQQRVSYNRLNFLVHHPSFKPAVKALLILLELSDNEKEFNERYKKVALQHFE